MKKLKVAQIGVLHDHAAGIFEAVQFFPEQFELMGYACTDDTKPKTKYYEGFKEYTVDELLNIPDLDAVFIECDELHLTEYAMKALQKGLHVHMDKPGGISQQEYDDMLNVAKEKKLVFSTGYMYRSNPAVQDVIRKIEKGDLGEIYAVEAHMDCLHTPEKREWLKQFPGGMMFFLGCHLVDLIYRIQGEPEEVIPLNCCVGSDGVTAEDYGMVVLKYKNGVSFAKTCAAEPGGFTRRQLVICGTKGTVELKPFEAYSALGRQGDMYTDARYVRMEDCEKYGWNAAGLSSHYGLFRRYDQMLLDFYDYIIGEKENPYTYEYESKLHQLVLKSCGL